LSQTLQLLTPQTTTVDPLAAGLKEQMPLIERIVIFCLVLVPLAGFLSAIALLWGKGIGALELSLMGSMYCISILGVTVGFHRLFTHKSYEANPVVKYLTAIFGSMAAQGPVLTWCAVHRVHHQYSDRAGDPHSPHLDDDDTFWGMVKGFFHAHVGWMFLPTRKDIARYIPDLMSDKGLVAIDRLFILWVMIGLAIPAIIGGLVTMSWWGALAGFLWGGMVRLFVSHHVTWSINSICHIWGRRDFDSHDHSTNNWLFALIGFGEGWHNNHHAFPTSARHGLKWWQIDTSYMIIKAMSWLKLVKNIRVPSAQHLKMKAK